MNKNKRTNLFVIQTPEGIEFSFLLAGQCSRFLAWLIDLACIMAFVFVGALMANSLTSNPDVKEAINIIAYFFISIGYGIILEWYLNGRTLGKHLLKLRVMDEQGLSLRLSQIVIRNLLRAIDMLPFFYFLGGIISFFSKRVQRLGDIAANTIVVRIPQFLEPDMEQLAAGKFNSLLHYPHLCARLRQTVTLKEAGIALQALLRRDEIIDQYRVELFFSIASLLKKRVPFPQEASYGISDEQYVRNAVTVLFKSQHLTFSSNEKLPIVK